MSIRTKTLSVAAAVATTVSGSHAVQRTIFNAMRLNRSEFFRLWSNDETRFLSYVFAHRARSQSQILQDLWVCFELSEKRDGFFVEFGATNGRTNSNTWLLEYEMGWKGILAEPNPYWHAALAENRRTFIEHRCVSSASGKVVSFVSTEGSDPELSGIADFSQGEHFDAARKAGSTFDVETISLNDMLAKYGAPAEIDYMSIDTEGSELDVLSAFDFEKYHVKLFSIEHNSHTETAIQKMLESKGYKRVFTQFAQWDSWYVDSDLSRKKSPVIVAPAN